MTAKAAGGRRSPGLCVLCRVNVSDPIRHYTSDAHLAKVRADAERRAREG